MARSGQSARRIENCGRRRLGPGDGRDHRDGSQRVSGGPLSALRLDQGFCKRLEDRGWPAELDQKGRAHLWFADGHGNHGSGPGDAEEDQGLETDCAARGKRRFFHGESLGAEGRGCSALPDAAL